MKFSPSILGGFPPILGNTQETIKKILEDLGDSDIRERESRTLNQTLKLRHVEL